MVRVSRRNLLKGGLAAGVPTGVGGWAHAAKKSPFQLLDSLFEESLHSLPAATISAAVIKGGEVYWANTFGFQNLDSSTDATSDSLWPVLGSVSKLVTWTALMQLIEKKQIKLEGDVSQYLGFVLRNPAFPDTPITPYHLLTHSSSLSTRKMTSSPDSMSNLFCNNYEVDVKGWVSDYISPEGAHYKSDIVFDPYRPGDFNNITPDPIGVISGYSNLNAMIAAVIIENVTGLNLESYAEKFIFSPLGLVDIGWDKNKLDKKRIITPYEAKNTPRPPALDVFTKNMMVHGYMSNQASKSDKSESYFPIDNCLYFSPFNAAGLLG